LWYKKEAKKNQLKSLYTQFNKKIRPKSDIKPKNMSLFHILKRLFANFHKILTTTGQNDILKQGGKIPRRTQRKKIRRMINRMYTIITALKSLYRNKFVNLTVIISLAMGMLFQMLVFCIGNVQLIIISVLTVNKI
jgi:hypothetical protein